MAPILTALLPAMAEIGKSIANHFFPDPAEEKKRAEMEAQFALALMQQGQVMEKAAAEIVKAEAESENWLTASWRPITMLTFVTLIVARWLGYSAPGITEGEVLKLWDIVELGLGGYVIGRSAEKILPTVAEAMKRK